MENPTSLAEEYGAKNYAPLPVTLTRGEGVWVWDNEGKKYLDMLASYSAVNQGHCHPAIIKALVEQAGRITLTSRAFHNDQMGPFMRDLCALTGFPKALMMNSGAEAVETAVKAARKWAYKVKGVGENRARIIVCEGNFHGRTTTICGFSTEPQYRDGFGPFTPGFDIIPYGALPELEAAITDDTAAFIVEPIQGEAGIVVPPDGYLREAARICRERRVLFIADEIQSGFGRTGKMFAVDHEGVRPDVMILGKAMGGGVYPLSAIVADAEVMNVFHPGDHGSTFGGNPLACAVGRAAIGVLKDEKLAECSAALGSYMLSRLRQLKSPRIKEVRGRGLWAGVELKIESGPARPACEALMKRGVLAKETHGQVIRLAPPLVIDRATVDFAVDALEAVL